jgi:2-desacetyl-2-hydroxyethyl bacteriochlorophyllide A dehydrogenase
MEVAVGEANNHQVLYTRPGAMELAVGPIPAPGPTELLLRTRVSLISPGTERAFFLGLPNTTGSYPQKAGYSNIGEVVAVGSAVTDRQVGDRVATNGFHAAFITADVAACRPVPRGLADDQAVFFNLASIALQGVRKARIELGEPVAVVGAGLIGLLALQLARLQGALPAISIDQDGDRLQFALRTGADAALPADDQVTTLLAELCGGEGPAVVVEATGHPDAVPSAFAYARPLGRVVLLGSTRGDTEAVNFYRDVHKKGLTVLGAHNNARPRHESSPGFWREADDQRVALDLLALGRLHVTPYITHRFAWSDAGEAYALLHSWARTPLGMILDWTTHP